MRIVVIKKFYHWVSSKKSSPSMGVKHGFYALLPPQPTLPHQWRGLFGVDSIIKFPTKAYDG